MTELSTNDIAQVLKKSAHAFCLLLRPVFGKETTYWTRIYGHNVLVLDSLEYLPQLIAAIIGLTEGSLRSDDDIRQFILKNSPNCKGLIDRLISQLKRVPRGTQAALITKMPRPLPKIGDIFENDTAIWPMSPEEAAAEPEPEPAEDVGSELDEETPDDGWCYEGS